MDIGWDHLPYPPVAQFNVCNRSANHFSGWHYSIGLFACTLF